MADYAIIRIAKYHKTDLPGIQKHMGRQGECLSNPDIDPNKQYDNIALRRLDSNIAADVGNLTEKVNKRLSEVPHKRAIRKDAVVLCDVLVTYSPSKGQDFSFSYMDYFSQALDFIKSRYGKENIMYAVIHRDEKTPHMDVGFVPIIGDRLCAKEICSRKNLFKLHTDFAIEVGANFNLERGKRRLEGQTYVKHLTDLEYKTKTKEQELSKKIDDKKRELAKVTPRLPKKRSTFFGLRSEYDEKSMRLLARQAAAGRADLRELHGYQSERQALDMRSQELDKREAAIKAREESFEHDFGAYTPQQLADKVKQTEARLEVYVKHVLQQERMFYNGQKWSHVADSKSSQKSRGITRAKSKGMER